MDPTYFERLDVEESRRAEWRMLDEALRTRRGVPGGRRVRVRLGYALIALGQRLVPEAEAAASNPCR